MKKKFLYAFSVAVLATVAFIYSKNESIASAIQLTDLIHISEANAECASNGSWNQGRCNAFNRCSYYPGPTIGNTCDPTINF